MPSRYYLRKFVVPYCYHIYNRGANKSKVFLDDNDYHTFVEILAYYLNFPTGKALSIIPNSSDKNKVPNLNKLQETNKHSLKSAVHLIAYVIMPNHFHLLVKQIRKDKKDCGITNLMRRVSITYAMFAKKKYDRSGVLFEGKYKNVPVLIDKQLIYVTKYIHTNPIELLEGSEPLESYIHSSYPVYTGAVERPEWLHPKYILDIVSNSTPHRSYRAFAENIQVNYSGMKNILFDMDGQQIS